MVRRFHCYGPEMRQDVTAEEHSRGRPLTSWQPRVRDRQKAQKKEVRHSLPTHAPVTCFFHLYPVASQRLQLETHQLMNPLISPPGTNHLFVLHF